jgi:hypothetical protein
MSGTFAGRHAAACVPLNGWEIVEEDKSGKTWEQQQGRMGAPRGTDEGEDEGA